MGQWRNCRGVECPIMRRGGGAVSNCKNNEKKKWEFCFFWGRWKTLFNFGVAAQRRLRTAAVKNETSHSSFKHMQQPCNIDLTTLQKREIFNSIIKIATTRTFCDEVLVGQLEFGKKPWRQLAAMAATVTAWAAERNGPRLVQPDHGAWLRRLFAYVRRRVNFQEANPRSWF